MYNLDENDTWHVIKFAPDVLEQAKAAGITEVQTFAGWQALEDWKPYGNKPQDAKYVEFYFDAENKRFRERSKEQSQVPHDSVILGIWPAR